MIEKPIFRYLPQATLISFLVKSVSAGFPSPAEDYIEKNLKLDELLIQHPSSTFFFTVEGESMIGAGIYPNDILVVDGGFSDSNICL